MEYTVIFLFDYSAEHVLLMYKTKGPYPNTYNGVGGKVEPGEIPLDGAIREVKEEVRVNVSIRLNWLSTTTFPSGTILHAYYAQVNPSEVVQMEDEPIRWFNVNDIIDKPSIPMAGDGNARYYVEASLREIKGYGRN